MEDMESPLSGLGKLKICLIRLDSAAILGGINPIKKDGSTLNGELEFQITDIDKFSNHQSSSFVVKYFTDGQLCPSCESKVWVSSINGSKKKIEIEYTHLKSTPTQFKVLFSRCVRSPAPPTRSIRCTFVTTHVPTNSDTASASSRNKRRGVILGKKTTAITKEKGRTPVTYDDSLRGLPTSIHSQFVTDLSAYIKDRCLMLHPSWYDLPVTEWTRLLDFLSKKSEQMKAIRASTKKRPHSGGARTFAAQAEEYTKEANKLLT
ncbi:hypothetical protein LguiA_013064 [Lonicera macranthoides]